MLREERKRATQVGFGMQPFFLLNEMSRNKRVNAEMTSQVSSSSNVTKFMSHSCLVLLFTSLASHSVPITLFVVYLQRFRVQFSCCYFNIDITLLARSLVRSFVCFFAFTLPNITTFLSLFIHLACYGDCLLRETDARLHVDK